MELLVFVLGGWVLVNVVLVGAWSVQRWRRAPQNAHPEPLAAPALPQPRPAGDLSPSRQAAGT